MDKKTSGIAFIIGGIIVFCFFLGLVVQLEMVVEIQDIGIRFGVFLLMFGIPAIMFMWGLFYIKRSKQFSDY